MGSTHRSVWLACTCVLFVWLSGCDVFDAALLENAVEMEPATGGGDPDSGACVSTLEQCNGRDDDCDEEIDEDADDTCGLAHANSVCASGGRCVFVACVSRYVDCNDRIADGCEQLISDITCGMCGTTCDDGGQVVGVVDAGPDAEAIVDEEDSGAVVEPPICVEQAETCDGADNDCDEDIDEGSVCALQQCISSTPSARGATCDQCVCEKCGTQLDLCHRNPTATWAQQCDAVVECVVTETLAGNCPTGDCYSAGNGPCASQLNLASGGTSGTDNSQVASGCVAATPPTTACSAAIHYRDQCTLDLCATECE